jgi:hypothetical protein
VVLDMDSTGIPVYGEQENSFKRKAAGIYWIVFWNPKWKFRLRR